MSFEKHPTLNTAVLFYPMFPIFGFYMYVSLKACCIMELAHDDLKMWKCISDVVEEIKVTEQSAWWFGVSLISALTVTRRWFGWLGKEGGTIGVAQKGHWWVQVEDLRDGQRWTQCGTKIDAAIGEAAGLNPGKPGVLAASVGGWLVPPCWKELEMKTRARDARLRMSGWIKAEPGV